MKKRTRRLLGMLIIGVLFFQTMLFHVNASEVSSVSDSDASEVSSVSDSDAAGTEAEKCRKEIDVSDMVFHAGGWGIPMTGVQVYGLESPAEREQLKSAMLSAVLDENMWLDISSFGIAEENDEELELLYAEMLNEHPELFYVKPTLMFSYDSSTGIIDWVFFYYISRSEEERRIYADKLAEIISASAVTPEMTDVEKALILHDYLVQHCAYAYKEYLEGTLGGSFDHFYDAYGALVNGRAVCQGYAEAYNALLHAVGINSIVCSSYDMNHAWNIIQVDGSYYHVDATWDDPVWNKEGRAYHEYFLLSDAEIGNREHYGWSSAYGCVSTLYDENCWWTSVSSQIVILDKLYFLYDNSAVSVRDPGFTLMQKDGNEISPKYSSKKVWNVWGSSRYYINPYSYLSCQGDYLYFNDTLHIYAMKPTDSAPQVIYTYEGGDGYIYGMMVYEDGKAHLNIDTEPYGEGDSFIVVDLKAQAPVITLNEAEKTVSTTTAMEYSTDGGNTWYACSDNMRMADFGWDGVHEKVVAFRVPAANGRFTSDITAITIPASRDIITGTVTGIGSGGEQFLIQLIDENGNVAAETRPARNSAEYVLKDVAEGAYTLIVSRKNCVTRKYTVQAGAEAVLQNVELKLIGDVCGDGKLNAKDSKLLYNHISGVEELTGYEYAVGNVNGDDKINSKDMKLIYNHISGVQPLWQ